MDLQKLQKRVSALELIYDAEQQRQMYALDPDLKNQILNLILEFDEFEKISENEYILHKKFPDGRGTVNIRRSKTKTNLYTTVFYVYDQNNTLRCKAIISSEQSLEKLSDFTCVIWRYNTKKELIERLVELLLKEQNIYKPSQYTITVFGEGVDV